MTASVVVPRADASLRGRSAARVPLLLLTLAFAIGIAGTVLAYHEARQSTSQTHFAVFWVAQLTVLCTVVCVGSRRGLGQRARLVILATYALFNYLPKLLISPSHAVYFDEFGHWRMAQDILRTGQLRPVNTYQPIIRDFPGLELLTVGVHEVTRLSIWHSGQLVVGAAHVSALLLVFGITRQLGLSERLSFLSAVIYSLNPGFQFFDTEFSYESLGLTLALTVIWCTLRARSATRERNAWAWAAAGGIVAAGCAVTHHLSSAFMILGAALVAIFVRHRSGEAPLDRTRRWATWALFVWSVAVVFVWISVFARPTLSYIAPHVSPAFSQLAIQLHLKASPTVSNVGTPVAPGNRTLFANSLSPVYERYSGYASPFIALLAVLLTLIGLWLRRQRDLAIRLLPAIVLACAYLVSMPFTLTAAGAEGAHRSWAYTYLGVAVIGAYGVDRLLSIPPPRGWRDLALRQGAALVAMVVLAVGGVTLGEDVYYRFPGPYRFGTDTRSLTSETLTMARWANQHLPSGSHVITDRFTGEAIEGFTDLQVPGPHETEAYTIYRDGGRPNSTLRQFIATHHFTYFILDTRALTTIPVKALFAGFRGYYNVQPKAVRRITRTGFASTVYESAHYRIYALHPSLGASEPAVPVS